MNLDDLRTQYPKVYLDAVEVGRSQERDRISAHIAMGQKVDDLRLALHSVRSGAELAEAMTYYLQAGRNRSDIRARIEDDADVTAALEGLAPTPSSFGDPLEKAVADRFFALIDKSVDAAAIEDLEANER